MDKDSKTRRLTVYVNFPRKTFERLERRAKRERRTRNEIISDAVDDFRKKWSKLILLLLLVGAAGWIFLPDRNRDGIPDIIEKLFSGRKAPDWIEKGLGLPDNEIEWRLGLKPYALENPGEIDRAQPDSARPPRKNESWQIDEAQPDLCGPKFREVHLC